MRESDAVPCPCPLCLGKHGCRACDNKGMVLPAHAQRIAAGMRLRWDRHRRGLGADQEAARLGVPLRVIINRELGRPDDDREGTLTR